LRCDERRDAILLWVMGQLEGSQCDELLRHVESGCPECAGYVAEARELHLDLLIAPDPAEPSPGLERRLLERVASLDGVAPAPSQPRTGLHWRWAAAAALTGLLVGVLGYRLGGADPSNVAAAPEDWSEDLQVALAQLDEADGELAVLESRLAELEGLLEESSEQVELLRDSDVQRLALSATKAGPDASASMFWQWEEGYYCYLHARGLAAPEGDGVYALWMENESGERILVGSFRPDARGEGVVWAKLPADAGRAARALVSLEQAEPGQEPAGPILLASS
jgi:hypothetical protein